MTEINTVSLLQQMQQLASKAQGNVAESSESAGTFNVLMQKALGSVNDLTQQSDMLKSRYELGDDRVSISEVMVASQKASVAFEGTMRVRNKLVQAYQDIMNMPL
tara:strand:+ start:149 stop:463 length:315 start_codon:yes stop_codon:yes gene_type:complete